MDYPADIQRDFPIGWVITFPDFPEVGVKTETLEEALDGARQALIGAVEFCIQAQRAVPAPSEIREGQYTIELPANVAARAETANGLLIRAMLRSP